MKRPKAITIILLTMTVGLMLAVFYLGHILTSSNEKTSPVAPVKTKAQSTTYGKLITLNVTNVPSPTATPTVISTSTPTPTEIILAMNNSPTASPSAIITASASATKTQTLPQTGFINNALIMLSVSGLLIFFSFLF